MKTRAKNLLSVFGAVVCAFFYTGCEADAEESKSEAIQEQARQSNTTNTPPPSGSATNAATVGNFKAAADAATPLDGTNIIAQVVATNSTNIVINQQAVNKIPAALPTNLKLSKGVEEIVKLAQSGVSETVILLYIEKATDPFDLDAGEIVYLNDIGISSAVIAAMLNHDGASAEQQNALTNKVDFAVTTPPLAPTNAAPLAQQPAPMPYEVTSNYVANAAPVPDANTPVGPQQPLVIQTQPVVVEQQPVVVAAPAVTYSYFYSSLSPYGSWVYVGDYGWCWQPTIGIAHTGWRPYCHGGRWLYSDAGWYWHSDYSWGWAPFHYGRWHCNTRFGWVWTPDYNWGPSWVTWRRGGDYCGWAPLPPRCDVRPGVGFTYWDKHVAFSFGFGLTHDHYTFVSARDFSHRRVIDHVVPTEKTVNIYKDSTVVNNYIVGNNNTIVNNGISRDYVAAHTRSEVPKVAIRDEARGSQRVIPPDRIQKSGNDLVVYRPSGPTPQAQAALRQGQERIRPTASSTVGANGIAASAIRPGTTVSRPGVVTAAENHRNTSAGTVTARGEAVRPQVAARPEPVAFAKPAPLRPEPEPSISAIRSSRITQERLQPQSTRIAPAAGTPQNNRPLVSTPVQSSSSIQSGSIPTRSEASRAPTVSGSSAATLTPTTTRPGTITSGQSVSRPATTQPSYTRQSQLGQSQPAHSPDLAGPQTGSITSSGVSRPAPVQSQTPRSLTPTAPSSTATTVPRFSPQSGTVTTAPQAIRPSTAFPQSAPSVATPNVVNVPRSTVGRTEGFGSTRPVTPNVQRSPAGSGSAVQSQSVAPAPSRVAPSQPSTSAPVRSESPRSSVGSAPVRGGQYGSAPPAAAARPNVVQQQSSSSGSGNQGRGRVEIGR